MTLELFKLLLGVAIALFHRPLAGRIMEQEHVLDAYFRERGIYLPAPLSDAAARNLYFAIGVFVALFEAARIWLLL